MYIDRPGMFYICLAKNGFVHSCLPITAQFLTIFGNVRSKNPAGFFFTCQMWGLYSQQTIKDYYLDT